MSIRQAHARWKGNLKDGKGRVALSLVLAEARFKPDYVDALASVTIRPHGGVVKITRSHLVCKAGVAGIVVSTTRQKADATCPVSQVLAGAEITVETTLCAQ